MIPNSLLKFLDKGEKYAIYIGFYDSAKKEIT